MTRRPRFTRLLPPELGIDADNQAASDRELAYNTAAAQIYQQQRQARFQEEGTENANVAAKLALAKALGESPTANMDTLKARFYTLPTNVQAGIYKAGGAQFLNGTAGVKLLDSLAEDQAKSLDARTNEIASHIASGKIQYDMDSGRPSFYMMQDDPNDPTGIKKIKQPLNTLQLSYLDRGFKNGTIPNPFSTQPNNTSSNQLPSEKLAEQRRMSSADFQKVLDARASANSGSNGRATPQIPDLIRASLQTTQPMLPAANLAATLAYARPILPTAPATVAAPATDSALKVNEWLNRPNPSNTTNSETLNNVARDSVLLGSSAVDAVSSIPNALIRAGNWVNRAVQGSNAPQFPKIPYILDDSKPLPVAPSPTPIDDPFQAGLGYGVY